MTRHLQHDELHRAVEDFIRGQLPFADILSVDLQEDEDRSGDPVLGIRVVFDGPTHSFAQQKPVGLTRFLRNHLLAMSEEAFPVMRFVSKTDSERATVP